MVGALSLQDGRVIPHREIRISTARASGPGGQHVNKTETKVTLRFSILKSSVFSAEEKARLLSRLEPRLTRASEILVSASAHRERRRNLDDAFARLALILDRALRSRRPRKKTAPGKSAHARRIEEKRISSEKKRLRKSPRGDDSS